MSEQPQYMDLDIGDLRLHLARWGDAARPPLILLHGLASTHHMFDLIAPVLAAEFDVIACDQRGHGQSGKPESGYDFETVARDLDRVLAALGLGDAAVSLAGHSWGAYTTLYYAATRPGRIRRAALIDGGIRAIGDLFPTWEQASVGMAPPDYTGMTLEDIQRMIRERWLAAFFRPELEALALSIFDTSDAKAVRPHLPRAQHLQIARELWAFRPEDYYRRVTCPLQIVVALEGDAPDDAISAYAAAAAEALARSEFVWMRKTHHDIPWQRPVELADALLTFFTL